MSSVELLKIVDPALYYGKFIQGGLFPDGRAVDVFKTFSFKRGVVGGGSAGSALVRHGGVTIVCNIEASITPRCTEPMMSIQFESSVDGAGVNLSEDDSLNEVRCTVEDLIARGTFFKKEALYTNDKRLEWKLAASVKLLHAEGDVCSSVVGALLAALTDVRLPPLLMERMEGEEEDDIPVIPTNIKIDREESRWSRLQLSQFPVASTFMMYDDEKGKLHLLADPPADVQPLCHSRCTIIIGHADSAPAQAPPTPTILALRTDGACTDELLQRMVGVAEARQAAIVKMIKADL